VRKNVHKKTYNAWMGLRRRCNNPRAFNYKNYGGRGITYDYHWSDYRVFLLDMGEAPQGLTLERKNNDGNYCKENCKWATPQEQATNRRIRSDNTSGISGVSFNNVQRVWVARGNDGYQRIQLYKGSSFEAAVEARKLYNVKRLEELK
jgi:hypothetical protein